jgi:protein ImuB
VLYELHSRGGLRVVAGGSECGIRPGMPLAEAVGVPFRSEPQGRRQPLGCSDRLKPGLQLPLCILPHDPLADRATLAELAVWCERFSPAVAIEAAERPDGLALDVTGLGPLFGGEAALAERVVREFHERGLAARVAIADTLGGAWAAAREWQVVTASIIAPDATLAALGPLPVAALRLPEETVALLAAVGIRSIEQLAALPRAALSARFSPQLLAQLDRATGVVPELLVPHRAAPQVTAEWSFETPVDSSEAIQHVLEELIRRVSRALAVRDEGALGLVCRIACADRERIALAVGLFRPSASPKHLWELLKLRLETIRLTAPVTALAVEVTSAAGLSHEQQELFAADRSRDAPRHLAALVERLSSRLGREAVVRPVLMPDAQPEYASVDLPWTGGSPSGKWQVASDKRSRDAKPLAAKPRSLLSRRRSTAQESRPTGVRPVWIADSPLPIPVISVVPAGPPAQFHWDGIDYRIARSWGPERIETGWWRTGGGWGLGTRDSGDRTLARSSPQSPVPSPSPSTGIRRDYYRVETTSGRRFWLFRSLADARWFFHGEFG